MRRIFFDAGPIISLTMSNLVWLLEPAKSRFAGDFCITPSVKEELIDHPFQTRRFKFEAIQVMQYLNKDILKVVDSSSIRKKTQELLSLANRCFSAKGSPIKIVHLGEMETIAAAVLLRAEAVVIDERTTRYLIDKPERLARRMADKLHTPVDVDKQALGELKRELDGLYVIRSTELVTIAFEHGLLDMYLSKGDGSDANGVKGELLEAALWDLKMNGCAISESEINDVVKFETK